VIAEDMVGWAVEFLEYFLNGPEVRDSPLLDGGIVLVLEIADFNDVSR
jgi:hypothetical protein